MAKKKGSVSKAQEKETTTEVDKSQEKENTTEVDTVKEKLDKVELAETDATNEIEEGVPVLGEKTENSEPVCSHCNLANPKKRCSKRHAKCMKKMYCNETCEQLDHKKKESNAVAKPASKKVDTKKKKGKSKGEKPSGEFWWNNTVYASW